MTSRLSSRPLRLVARGLVAALVVLLFWPTRLGGSATYTIVKGVSMQPRFTGGDFVLARRVAHYDVGDIVVYRVPANEPGGGHMVIHRIVGREGSVYVFKGDNRTTNDSWHPTDKDLIGRAIVHVPALGRIWLVLLTPLTFAAGAAVAITRFFWPRDGRETGVES